MGQDKMIVLELLSEDTDLACDIISCVCVCVCVGRANYLDRSRVVKHLLLYFVYNSPLTVSLVLIGLVGAVDRYYTGQLGRQLATSSLASESI